MLNVFRMVEPQNTSYLDSLNLYFVELQKFKAQIRLKFLTKQWAISWKSNVKQNKVVRISICVA